MGKSRNRSYRNAGYRTTPVSVCDTVSPGRRPAWRRRETGLTNRTILGTMCAMITKKIVVVFFATEAGAEPVRDWLKDIDKPDRVKIGEDIRTVEFGWPIGMPVCKPLGQGLYEVRTTLKDRIARVMFGIVDSEMVLLHGFIKKSQATPKDDLELARTRLRVFRRQL
jgi:phage-related protein